MSSTPKAAPPSPLTAALQQKIEARTARLGIIGLGYVGLPLTLLFSEEKFVVTGFDIDRKKVQTLNADSSYIHRIPPTDIATARKRGFSATAEFAQIEKMDAIIICVPTPLNENREPDLSYIVSTAEAIAPHLRAGQLVLLESTTYPGTTEEVLLPILEAKNKHGVKVSRGTPGEHFFVAFSPEREDPGNDTVARRDIPKVVGGVDTTATDLAAALYGTIFNRTVRVSTPAAAEMTKLLENIYRCVNIAMVNELKQLCLRMGIDIWEVIEAASTKPFGFHPFYPGPGLGGHCIPIDPFYLSWKAKQFDFHTRFIELSGEVNWQMPHHVVERTMDALNRQGKALKGAQVLILGLAYKKNIDDLRESPSIRLIELFRERGAQVSYHDPYCPKMKEMRHQPKYMLEMESVPLETAKEADVVVIATDHDCIDY